MSVLAEPIAELFAHPLVSTGLTLLAIALVALWLAAAWWAYQDATRRSQSALAPYLAAAWIVLSTPLMLPIALAVYSFARPQTTASDERARALARELGAAAIDADACAGCQAPIEAGWIRCPTCAEWLAAPCQNCGVWSARDLAVCPFCAHEDDAATVLEPAAIRAPEAAPGAVADAVHPGPGVPVGPGLPVAARIMALGVGGHGTAAASASPAAAVVTAQRSRVASSARPFSYATSRDISSASS
jgi:hypothetical protein